MQNEMRDRLIELLSKYFDIGDSYCYNLTRTKNAFACGTMGFDDFEEFDDEIVADIADHLIANGVTGQTWISVKDRLPESSCFVLIVFDTKIVSVLHYSAKNNAFNSFDEFDDHDFDMFPTHWMPLPQPPKE